MRRRRKRKVTGKVRDAEEGAKDEVWASYRYVVLGDQKEPSGVKVIDLGAGHASGAESLSGQVFAALKSQGLLNESVGAGYLERTGLLPSKRVAPGLCPVCGRAS